MGEDRKFVTNTKETREYYRQHFTQKSASNFTCVPGRITTLLTWKSTIETFWSQVSLKLKRRVLNNRKSRPSKLFVLRFYTETPVIWLSILCLWTSVRPTGQNKSPVPNSLPFVLRHKVQRPYDSYVSVVTSHRLCGVLGWRSYRGYYRLPIGWRRL